MYINGREVGVYIWKLDMKAEKFELLRFLLRSKHDLSARCYISDGPFFLEDRRQSGKSRFKNVSHSVEVIFWKIWTFLVSMIRIFISKNKSFRVITKEIYLSLNKYF